MTSVTIPEGIATISDNTFLRCTALVDVNIPQSITSIGANAFRYCPFISLELPADLQSIGRNAFQDCAKLTSINIPENVTTMGSCVFYGCTSLGSVTFPQNITNVPELTFQNCSNLTSFNISQNVTDIGTHAFYGCSKLASISIPKNVTNIADYAFNGCTKLEEVIVEWETPLTVSPTIFYGGVNLSECTLKVPQGTLEDYQKADVWKNFGQIITSGNISTADYPVKYNSILVTVKNRTITVANAIQPVTIYNLLGNFIVQGNLTEFTMPQAGTYIVRIGNEVQKVIVK